MNCASPGNCRSPDSKSRPKAACRWAMFARLCFGGHLGAEGDMLVQLRGWKARTRRRQAAQLREHPERRVQAVPRILVCLQFGAAVLDCTRQDPLRMLLRSQCMRSGSGFKSMPVGVGAAVSTLGQSAHVFSVHSQGRCGPLHDVVRTKGRHADENVDGIGGGTFVRVRSEQVSRATMAL